MRPGQAMKKKKSPDLVDPILNRLNRGMFHLISFYFIICGQFLLELLVSRGIRANFPIFHSHFLNIVN